MIKISPHDAGLTIAGGRLTDSDNIYWRIAQFLMPVHAYAPSSMPGENIFGQTFVPVTDTNCWIYTYAWNPERPLTQAEREGYANGNGVMAVVDENYVPLRNKANDYLIDRKLQKTKSYTGIKGVSEQDAAVQDSQGPIADRTAEHLGPTDLGIMHFRKLVMDAARALQDGTAPAHARAPGSLHRPLRRLRDAQELRTCPRSWSNASATRRGLSGGCTERGGGVKTLLSSPRRRGPIRPGFSIGKRRCNSR